MAGAILSTGRVDYNTPQWIVDAVREFFGGTIDLDPCSNAGSVVGATHNWILPEHDGLKEPWVGRVYVNPPFKTGAPWIQKAHDQHVEHGAEVVLCIPANVETRIWQRVVFPDAAGICWLDKRVKFVGMRAGIPKPIALVYFGVNDIAFGRCFRRFGHVYNPSMCHSPDVSAEWDRLPDINRLNVLFKRNFAADAINNLTPAMSVLTGPVTK